MDDKNKQRNCFSSPRELEWANAFHFDSLFAVGLKYSNSQYEWNELEDGRWDFGKVNDKDAK